VCDPVRGMGLQVTDGGGWSRIAVSIEPCSALIPYSTRDSDT
jgi:hypothetical protein